MIGTVSQSTRPKTSNIKGFISRIDYEDAFAVKLYRTDISIENIYLNVFGHTPRWINKLLELRNKMVKPFGLKTNSEEMKKENLKVGEKAGIFKIYAIYENEIIAGEDERHLNFRVSVLRDKKMLTMSTLVQYNNWLGKLYFFIVKPFHKIVVKSMLKSAVRNNRI